ncbi:MAG: TetR/AcrR family transcriptional regulator [Deltaproteobacteria bacterium]|nr:TetR/AcrR family transcriptional regulator [Candidatus Zymogenaceae bacterium]
MKEDTRKRIMDISLELSRRYGFLSFRVEDILKYAHISRATFYKYFRNRQEVFFALVDDKADEIDSAIRSAVNGESGPYDKLRVFITLGIAGIRELLGTLNIRMSETDLFPAMSRERIERKNERDLRIIRDILSEGEREGSLVLEDMDVTARAVMGIGREIGLKAIMENKDMETVQRETGVILTALFFGISSQGHK